MPRPGNYVTEKHIFQHYPYKKHNEHHMKNVYVKKKERTDMELSVDWPEWCRIVDCYKKKVLDHIFTGKRFEMPSKLGDLTLMKIKPKRTKMINWQDTEKYYGKQKDIPWNERRFIRQKLDKTHGYFLFLHWNKNKVKNSSYFKLRINTTQFHLRKHIKITDIQTFY